jgi:hypothetical protein
VLGLATGGCLFSLLTLLFSGAMMLKTQPCWESCGGLLFFLLSAKAFSADDLSVAS